MRMRLLIWWRERDRERERERERASTKPYHSWAVQKTPVLGMNDLKARLLLVKV